MKITMKIIKRILAVLLLAVIALAVGYFVYTANNFTVLEVAK